MCLKQASFIITACIFVLGLVPVPGSAQVVISEFMAKNDQTLVDGDGNYSDWIELYNTGSTAVDMTGWYLSDDTNSLTKWVFPSGSIAAGEHLVVFASGQAAGYVDSLGYLHTTFKLSGDGESVILSEPDGTTIAHAIDDYPEQSDDVSYGYGHDVTYSYLVVEGQDATAIEGSSEPSGSWKSLGFDDSAWLAGQTGVGYETRQAIYGNLIRLALPGDMYRRTYSAYIRIPFTVSDIDVVSQLVLRMKYDDGFAAYINGTEVAAANTPQSLAYTSIATVENDGTSYQDFTILDAEGLLVEGDNMLAIHSLGFNQQRGKDFPQDQVVMPVLTGLEVGEMETNSLLFLEAPTPGAANVNGVLGYVGDTSFSVDRGFYTNVFDVEIFCKTEGASIYYTMDGTTPAADNGTLYTAPITIDRTTVLRAAAFVAGYQPSDTDTQTYIFLDDIIAQGTDATGLAPYFPSSSVNGQVFDYGMDPDIVNSAEYGNRIKEALLDIPTFSVVTDPDNLFDPSIGIYVNAESDGAAWERPMSVELIHPDGTKGFQINGGIRIRGGMSRQAANPKHSFRMFFRSEYGTSRLNYELFGDEGVDSFKRMDLRTGQNFSWHLGSAGANSTWLYDIFVRDAHREMGQPYTRGNYCHLYLNGMYWGLFQTEERPEARYGESYFGGDSDNFDIPKSGDDRGLIEATDGNLDAYQDLWAAVDAGVTANADYFAIQGMNSDGTVNNNYTRLLDVDNVADYMLTVFYVGNRDSPLGAPNSGSMPRNLFALYNRGNPDGFKFIAHDAEHALGYHLNDGVNYNITAERSASTATSLTLGTAAYFNPWWLHLELTNNEEYRMHFADRVHRHFHNAGILTPGNAAALLLERKEEMDLAIIAESARWGDYKTATPRTRDADWLPAVEDGILASYLQASPSSRRDVVLSQIRDMGWYPSVDAPAFSQHGGSIVSGFPLSISGNGTIYYTTDGTDPRAIGGAVAGTAYGSAITLDRSAQVKARVLSGGEWSALTEATFVVDEESPLRITEIMYNPAGTNDSEFIELLNTGTETVGLAGTGFSEGIHFDFINGAVATLAPGEYAVLVSNYTAFTNRYANWVSINIAGEFHGKFFIPTASLDNGGEQIAVVDGLGNSILDFEYNDWYEATDGGGFSLTLNDPFAATNTWSESSAWRPSRYSGGTPGAAPVDFMSPDDLLINEALTHQDDDTPGDWVELYNASTNTIDINGWFVSDDEDDLDKVELSGLSPIAPGGYLVLTEASHFGTTVAGTNGFALSELGDEIYLSSGEGGELTGYWIGESFGAAERDVTFGRHVKSTGEADFAIQSTPTPGMANAYPAVGDIIITEIMYHPADSNAFEYIELVNAGTAPVPLYTTTNAWRLNGAVEFSFPIGTVLGAGESLVLSETNSAAFAAYYGVPVFGTYDGQLANEGEELRLEKPGNPEQLTGEVPYIVVERIDYNDKFPWPGSADGGGDSLERTDAASYPNDPASWMAGTGSPGVAGFADTDGDDLPDSWEEEYFGAANDPKGGKDDDWDSDGATNYEEWRAGTNPTNPSSVFEFTSMDASSSHVFSWASETGKVYTLWVCTNLLDGEFLLSREGIPATPPVNIFTSETEVAESAFYLLSVEEE